MGRSVFSATRYEKAVKEFAPAKGPATAKAEQHAKKTGKLNPLVDPAGYGVIRESRPRMEQGKDGLWELTVGTPLPIETIVDTTGSMGGNVDVALRVLPRLYELCCQVLPGYDIHIATGIFGDVQDKFVLCRPQFEMLAEKIVEQLTLMVPERDGGDSPEDPHYGIFGAAYLTKAYISRIGLKGYHFTVSDATAHDWLDADTLRRIFGPKVFEKVAENGHQITEHNLPETQDVVKKLLETAHAFFLQVGESEQTNRFWRHIYGSDRVVCLPDTELLPQVQAAIIGLTEGTLDLQSITEFLTKNNVSAKDAKLIARSIANIPIGAQAALPNYNRRPRQGDLFREKTDTWPITDEEAAAELPDKPGKPGKKPPKTDGPNWL